MDQQLSPRDERRERLDAHFARSGDRLGAAPSLEGARILVAEDEAVIAMDITDQLESVGATVVGPVRTAADALARAAREPLDAAVLDLRLGPDSAHPIALALKQRGIPFLFYTGQLASDPEREKWPDIVTVTKPATGEALLTALANLIEAAT